MSLARTNQNSGYDAYKNNEISTMSQGKLIVMLYDGAVRFLNIAIENMTPRRYEIVNKNIIKAQEIINELMTSLNVDEGGKLANDLLAIYIYIKKRLIEANIEKDSAILKEIIRLLNDLKGAWDEIARKEASGSLSQSSSTNRQRVSGISIQG